MKVVASDLGTLRTGSLGRQRRHRTRRALRGGRAIRGRGRGQAGQPRARDRSHPGALLRGDRHRLARCAWRPGAPRPITRRRSARLRRNADVAAEFERYRPQFGRPVDHELSITLERRQPPVSAEAADEFRVGVPPSRRVERHDARNGLGGHRQGGAMDPARAGHGTGEHGHPLALPRRRRRQAAAGERPPRPARDAAPDSHSRPALPGDWR